jgi:hypothetical protein
MARAQSMQYPCSPPAGPGPRTAKRDCPFEITWVLSRRHRACRPAGPRHEGAGNGVASSHLQSFRQLRLHAVSDLVQPRQDLLELSADSSLRSPVPIPRSSFTARLRCTATAPRLLAAPVPPSAAIPGPPRDPRVRRLHGRSRSGVSPASLLVGRGGLEPPTDGL